MSEDKPNPQTDAVTSLYEKAYAVKLSEAEANLIEANKTIYRLQFELRVYKELYNSLVNKIVDRV